MNINAYGLWRVTTEADVEGRSIKDLGMYEGSIEDIAFELASKCYYSLRFSRIEAIKPRGVRTGVKVNVSLDPDSGTWEMSPSERVAYFKAMLATRGNVGVENGTEYSSVRLVDTTPNAKSNVERQKALSKLTSEERRILGLSD